MSGLTARTSRGTAGECCKTDNWLLTTDCRLQSSHRMDPTLTPAALRKLRRALLAWYDEHRRELPWRRDADPYRVWVSEIMLQQTRVAAVVDHYARFLQKFPTVQTLAAARESSVLDLGGVREFGGAVHFDDFPHCVGDPVPHARRRGDEVDIELALETLLHDFQVQQPQKPAAKTETQRHRVFGFEVEGAVVETQ